MKNTKLAVSHGWRITVDRLQTTCRMTPRDDARLRLFVGSVVTLLVVFVFFVVFVFW